MKIRLHAPIVQNAFLFRQKIASHYSPRHSSYLSQTANELKSRTPKITYDYLYPTPSHLLQVSLLEFLPAAPQEENFQAERLPLTSPSPAGSNLLPSGHHLVYFPPPIPSHELLPDGTDTWHSPQSPTPFQRRLWAGGSLVFNNYSSTTGGRSRLTLDGARAACIEGIRDVTIKGPEGEEKIFVHVERRIGHVNADPEGRRRHVDEGIAEEDVRRRLWEGGDEAAIIEKRDLVFLRGDVKNITRERLARVIRRPDFSVELTLPPSLLFRFSALTFNAHAIHLDPLYSREVEGHRNLLVHGPLLLVLMLSVLRSRLPGGEVITGFTYRNLAPLYAHERMWVCLRRGGEDGKEWKVWIEGPSRSYAVRGSATTETWCNDNNPQYKKTTNGAM